MFNDFEKHLISVNGCEIACVTAGQGEPLLMLHGFPQNMALWAKIAPILVARGYKVVCTDLRGYGASRKHGSDSASDDYSFRALAGDQLELMRTLGHHYFHVVGHDRGARTAYRMALDHPEAIASLTLMDIVPTDVLLNDLRKEVAESYWHWFFLAQPSPFPERIIEADPDFFFENCLFGWGAAGIEEFDAEQLAAYRASWHQPSVIAAYCSDYRTTLSVDFTDDVTGELKTSVPTLVLYGASGSMAKLYDIPAVWAARCSNFWAEPIRGGHFFPDSSPLEVTENIKDFLNNNSFQHQRK